MKTYLVTGGAGFIGSNFVLYMLKKYEDIRIINLDKLTYAGNLENLKSIENDERHIFVHGDICDAELVSSLFEKYEIDYVAHFAAESHVDRSIEDPEIFVKTNVMQENITFLVITSVIKNTINELETLITIDFPPKSSLFLSWNSP